MRNEWESRCVNYGQLIRPFTLLAPLVVSLSVMGASSIYTGGDIDIGSLLLSMLAASICLAVLNGASNALNQATDYREDCLSKPYRPLPQGLVSVRQAYRFSLALYLLALVLSLLVHPLFSLFVLLIALFSITYSLPPRMKRLLLINQLWVALPRGLFGILASWSVFGNPFDPLPLAIGGIAAVFLFGGTTTKDAVDVEADRAVGTKTLLNVFGLRTTALFSMVVMTTAFLAILPLVQLAVLPTSFLPLAALSVGSILVAVLMVYKGKSKRCENTRAWVAMYLTYLFYTIGFAALTVVTAANP